MNCCRVHLPLDEQLQATCFEGSGDGAALRIVQKVDVFLGSGSSPVWMLQDLVDSRGFFQENLHFLGSSAWSF